MAFSGNITLYIRDQFACSSRTVITDSTRRYKMIVTILVILTEAEMIAVDVISPQTRDKNHFEHI